MAMKVLVLGGGLAGLSAAWTLLDRAGDAVEVEVLERGHLFGGKAGSMPHPGPDGKTYDVDHGLHVVFDYPNMRALLRDAAPSALDGLTPKAAASHVYSEPSSLLRLEPLSLPSPFHLVGGLPALTKLKGTFGSPLDGIALARLFLAAIMLRPELLTPRERRRLDAMTFYDFARELGASSTLLASEVLAAGPRSTFTHVANGGSALAMLLAFRLTQQNADAQRVSLLTGPMGKLLIDPLVEAVKGKGGSLTKFSPVLAIHASGSRVTGVTLGERPRSPHKAERQAGHLSFFHSQEPVYSPGAERSADMYVAALPPHALARTLDEELKKIPYFARVADIASRPTIGFQIYYDEVVTPPDLTGLVIATPPPFSTLLDRARVWRDPDGPGSVIELVGEDSFGPPEEQMANAERVLHALFPKAQKARVIQRYYHRSGHDEYFLTTAGSARRRPSVASPLDNLVLAGDFTDHSFGVVGMEGAIVSGIEAANEILRKIGRPRREVKPMSEPGTMVRVMRAALKATGIMKVVTGYTEA